MKLRMALLAGAILASGPAWAAEIMFSGGAYAPDADGKCPGGVLMPLFDTKVCRPILSGVCDDPGLNNNYNADQCAAARKEQDEKERQQMEANAVQATADAHDTALAKCNDKPTTFGVIMCRCGVK